MHNIFDVESFFKCCLESIGHPLDGKVAFDTMDWQRYACSHSKNSKTTAGYRAHSDGVPSIKVSCMKCDINQSFSYSISNDYQTSIQRNNLRQEIALKKAKLLEQAAAERTKILAKIKHIWLQADSCLNHPYLEYKQVTIPENSHLRITADGTLLCPVFSIKKQLVTIQKIFWDSIESKFKKRFYKGATPKNGGLTFGDITATNTIYFAEGIATALTIHEATNIAVICTYGKHFDDLADILKRTISDKQFIYCCDIPSQGELSTSEDNAKKAISVAGGSYVLPDFSNIPNELYLDIHRSDFNDLFVLLILNGKTRSAALSEIQRQLTNINHGEDIMTGSVIADDKKPIDLPNSLPEVLLFEPGLLPPALRNHVVDVADRQQCPVDFVAVSAVCGLSALLGRKALISPKQNDDWVVTPNLWGTLIGRPSAMKSPAMKTALRPLYKIERDASTEYQESINNYKFNKELSDLNMQAAKVTAKKHLEKKQFDDARATMLEAMFDDNAPTKKRIIVNDTSVEKLGVLLNENPNGLIHIRDELSGWIAKLSNEQYQQDRSFYIECFDGDGRYAYARITREDVDIENLTLSLLGGIQPSKISPLVRNTIRGVGDDGLLQRFQLATWPNDRFNWKWTDRSPNEKYQLDYDRLFMLMHKLKFLSLTDDQPPIFRFTADAQELFIEWMTENHALGVNSDTHPAFESHLLKTPKTIASLALIFELSNMLSMLPENKSPVFTIEETNRIVAQGVGATAAAQALEWADYLRSHAERLYSSAVHQSLEGARLILKRLDKLDVNFYARDILRKQWSGLTEEQIIKEALEYLSDYHHIYPEDVPSTDKGGRPTTRYRKNNLYLKKVAK
jgi:phage/plasmid primase-like uncharacterized protein